MDVAAHSSDDQNGGSDNALTGASERLRASLNAQIARDTHHASKPDHDLGGAGELPNIADNSQDANSKSEKARGDTIESQSDDISIASSEVSDMECQLLELPSHGPFQAIQKVSDKFARVTGLYIKSLEARVGMLEGNVRELQIQNGQRKKEEDVR